MKKNDLLHETCKNYQVISKVTKVEGNKVQTQPLLDRHTNQTWTTINIKQAADKGTFNNNNNTIEYDFGIIYEYTILTKKQKAQLTADLI